MAATVVLTHPEESSSVVDEHALRKFGFGAMLTGGLAGGRMPRVGAAAGDVCAGGGGGGGFGAGRGDGTVVGGRGGGTVVGGGGGGAGGLVVVGTGLRALNGGAV